VTVNANTTESPSVFAVGGSVGVNTAGIAATVTVTTVTDNTLAYVDAAPSAAAAGFVQGGTGSGSSGDVTIDAESTFNLLGTAGALAFGGKAGVGVGVDTGVVTRNTHAYVGANADVNADGSVVVMANATETIISVSVAGAFSGKVAVGLTAGVSVLNLTTTAYVDSGAVVIAKNNVLDSAEDQTTVTLVSGNLSGAGNVAVGVGAGISVLTKNTDSYIASDAQVTALAQGSAIMANTGRFGTPTGTDSATPAANVEFTTANVSGNVINATGHGLNTGDEVVYDGAGLPLGGLNSGGEYYVIRVDADHFELAASYADAQSGDAIALIPGLSAATDQHTVERLSQIGVPSVSTSNVSSSTLDLSNLADNLDGPPQQASRQGVVVVAVSTNHMDAAGAAGGGAGGVAVQVAGAVAVHDINTLAEIRSGAEINQADTAGANANQSVYVDAGRSYHNLTLGLGAAFSGTAAVSPSIAVPVLTGTTAAHILGPTSGTDTTLVSAKQDVEVAALAQSDFVAVSVGISGSGEVAIAGSVTVIDVNTTTEATINGLAVVKAGGNVLVSAFDTTTAYSIAGAVGIGIGAGAGAGAFAVSVITKNTNALIENGATVDADGNGTNTLTGIMTGSLNAQQAIQGVAVQAYSNEKLVNVAGSGAGGLYVGIAGAVDVEETNSNTVAAIQNGAKVNQNDATTANLQQAVAVGARNDLTITAVAGALAGGAAGIGAGVDVEAIHNNAEAFIAGGGTAVRAAGAVEVDALTNRNLLSVAIAVGAGGFALGGGISVLSIGGGFNATYSGSNEGGSSSSSNALNDSNGNGLLGSIDSSINQSMTVVTQQNSGGLPPLDPVTAVDNTNHTVDFGTADNLQTGDAVTYSNGGGAAINGLQDGQTYFVIADGADKIQLATTRDNALAGIAIPITSVGATGTNHSFSANAAGIGNTATSNASSSLPNNAVTNGTNQGQSGTIASGTTAAIATGAVITANTVAVDADQSFTLGSYPGGAGLGGVAIGLGIAVVTVDSNVSAYVDKDVVLTGLGGTGSLSVDATRDATYNVLGIAGALSGFVSLGGAVAYVTDGSNVQATLGVGISDTGLNEASSLTDATTVGGAGFAVTGVDAENTVTMNIATEVGSISEGAGLGAAITFADVEGTTQALIGDFAAIGSSATPVGGISVTANRTVTVGPYASGGPMGIGIAGGLLGGAAGYVQVMVGGNVAAGIGNSATVFASGDISVSSTSTATANVLVDGGAGGAIAVGVMLGKVTMGGTVSATIGQSPVGSTGQTKVRGRSVTLSATGTPTANLKTTPAAGGILAGSGAVSTIVMTPTVLAKIAASTNVTTTSGNVTITSTSTPTANGDAHGHDYGGVTLGISKSDITLTNINTASVDSSAVINAGNNFSLLATTSNSVTDTSEGSSDAVIPISKAEATANVTDTTSAAVGALAQITAYGGPSVPSPIGALSVKADMSTAATSNVSVDTGGLGTNGQTNSNLTISGTTTTDIGSKARLEAGAVSILAYVDTINAQAISDTSASALGTSTSADSELNTTSVDTVTLENDALIIGHSTADIEAQQVSLPMSSQATSSTSSLGGDTSPTANNTLSTTTTVTAAGTAALAAEVDTRVLTVEANADVSPGFTATATRDAAPIDTGSATSSQTLVLNRSIVWNATTVMLGAVDPDLEIDANGNITKSVNISATLNGSTFVVGDIVNAGALDGSMTFTIPASFYDTMPSGYGTITSSATITGAPSVIFHTGFDQVTIFNQSTDDLQINGINAVNPSTDFISNININVGSHSGFTPTITSTPGDTKITIQNTSTPNITFEKLIYNPFGTTTAIAHGGNIISGSTAAVIQTGGLVLDAPSGYVGSSSAPIEAQATGLFAATAQNDIYVDETGTLDLGYVGAVLNNVTVNGVSSTGGTVDLQATVSIIDDAGNTGNAANILASTIILGAQTGAIGTLANPLDIGSFGATTVLTAFAGTGITIDDVANANALDIASLTALAGDITITTIARAAFGEDIVLGAAATITAENGSVTPQAGDSLTTVVGSIIRASGTVTVGGDFNASGVNPAGKTIDIEGTINATSATVTSGPDSDIITLTNVAAGTPTTIAGGGNDAITIGFVTSQGRVLNQIFGTLTIDGGKFGGVVGNSTLTIDDSGDTNNTSGTLGTDANWAVLAGLGMGALIHYLDIAADTEIKLGSGNDFFNVQSTLAATTTTVTVGAGANTVRVGGPNGNLSDTVNGIQGLLNVNGNGTSTLLNVIDAGETRVTTGILDRGRLTGLGMGSANPTTVNANAGIQYSGIAAINILLGSGADNFTVAGVSTPTMINTGTGGDTVTVGLSTGTDGLTQINAPLLVQESGNANDQLIVLSNTSSALTLDRTSPTVGLVTGLGNSMNPGRIRFAGVTTLTVDQSDVGKADTLMILNTVTTTIVQSGGGGHTVIIDNVENQTTLDLGSHDTATVFDATTVNGNAVPAVSVVGDATNTLTLDLSATTTAVNALVEDGASAGTTGILHDFTASSGDIGFASVGHVNVDLGTGNDVVVVDTTDATSVLGLNGGDGNDFFQVRSIGDTTNISGGNNYDTVALIITAFPTANEFALLNVDVEELIVDNSAYSGAVAWTNLDGAIYAASGDTSNLVVNSSGAQLTRIIGGSNPDNTLNAATASANSVTGTVTDHMVVLESGLAVLGPSGTGTYLNYGNVMTFDGLQTGETSYSMDNFTLTTDNAQGFVLNEATSASAEAQSGTDTFTLTSGGNPFSLYSLQLAGNGPGSETTSSARPSAAAPFRRRRRHGRRWRRRVPDHCRGHPQCGEQRAVRRSGGQGQQGSTGSGTPAGEGPVAGGPGQQASNGGGGGGGGGAGGMGGTGAPGAGGAGGTIKIVGTVLTANGAQVNIQGGTGATKAGITAGDGGTGRVMWASPSPPPPELPTPPTSRRRRRPPIRTACSAPIRSSTPAPPSRRLPATRRPM
jgi:hypothetical protein